MSKDYALPCRTCQATALPCDGYDEGPIAGTCRCGHARAEHGPAAVAASVTADLNSDA
ncbi:MAG: hypothetical protein JWM90_253 [Thermoleophilia bacterium]|nr:hypothetical protein [Thermoleophilia bacterium]